MNTIELDRDIQDILLKAEPVFCLCECGKELYKNISLVKALRENRKTFAEIGEILNISSKNAQQISRSPSKYIKGHWSKKNQYTTEICKNCNLPFKRVIGSKIRFCYKRSCKHLGHKEWIERLDEKQYNISKNKTKVVILEKKLWQKQDQRFRSERLKREERERISTKKREDRIRFQIERKILLQKQKNMEKARSIYHSYKEKGKALPWHINNESGLVSPDRRNELDELLYEQKREEEKKNYSWAERALGSKSPSYTKSLDAMVFSDSDFTLLDTLTSREDFTSGNEIFDLMVNNVTNTQSQAQGRKIHLVSKQSKH